MKNEKIDLEISSNFGQNLKQAKRFKKEMANLLTPFKKAGLLNFKAIIKRKCDFCGKILEKGEKFKTIGEKDKCEKCQKEKTNDKEKIK